jgi:hypothetical protein
MKNEIFWKKVFNKIFFPTLPYGLLKPIDENCHFENRFLMINLTGNQKNILGI